MKVYVVTEGEYSDYHIEMVTLDKKIAQAKADLINQDEYACAYVEEYDLVDDKSIITEAADVVDVFFVSFDTGGVLSRISQHKGKKKPTEIIDCYKFADMSWVKVRVCENDKDKAIKIARDKRAEYLAEKYGIQ